MNINGLACGIEMYLGENLLKSDDTYIPIRWKEYNESIKKYHGVLSEKELIQNKFRERIKSGELGPVAEMQVLLNHIFNSFRS